MSADSLRIILNNVQRSLRLNVGMFGQWNLEANKKLIKTLAKAKRLSKTPDGTNLLALGDKNKDKNEHLAIEDAKHDAKDGTENTKDEDIDQDPAATDDIEMKGTNKRDDNGKPNDSSSSSSDSSSSSSLEEPTPGQVIGLMLGLVPSTYLNQVAIMPRSAVLLPRCSCLLRKPS